MNTFAIIILITLIVSYLLDLTADKLNLSKLTGTIPDEFKDIYDEDVYKKSQAYTRTNTRFGFITSTFSLITVIVFWFAGGFNFLDLFVRSYFDTEISRGLAYISILLIANSIITLPFSIYSTFVIEEKFGFNKTTVKTFILDILKSTVLSVLIGFPVLALIIYIIQSLGAVAFLAAWAATVIISLIIHYVAPTFIMPFFNKFKTLEEGELRNEIFEFAKKVQYPLTNIFVMDGSKRSTKSNAFFTGFGKNKRIVLFDTLIEKHTNSELLAILAHEIGHYKKKHILQGSIISYLHMGLLFYLLSIFINQQGLFDAFYMENTSIYAGLLFFSMLYSPIEMIISIFMNMLSRKNEFEADRFAVEKQGEHQHLISALKKLSKDNLSNLTPHPFYVFLNYSHPPILQRIEAMRDD